MPDAPHANQLRQRSASAARNDSGGRQLHATAIGCLLSRAAPRLDRCCRCQGTRVCARSLHAFSGCSSSHASPVLLLCWRSNASSASDLHSRMSSTDSCCSKRCSSSSSPAALSSAVTLVSADPPLPSAPAASAALSGPAGAAASCPGAEGLPGVSEPPAGGGCAAGCRESSFCWYKWTYRLRAGARKKTCSAHSHYEARSAAHS